MGKHGQESAGASPRWPGGPDGVKGHSQLLTIYRALGP